MLVKRHIIYILLIFLSFLTSSVVAQSRFSKVDSVSMEIHFRWDNSQLDTLYMGNDKTLSEMRVLLSKYPTEQIDSIVIVSQSSPEGTYRHNQDLSTRRAATMRAYMEQQYPHIVPVLRVNPDGESWEQLREWVRIDTKLKNSSIERVLNIIDNNSISIETKKWRIERDPIYRYLYSTYSIVDLS